MKLQSVLLPERLTGNAVIIRHYLTLDDGTVHFQDEKIGMFMDEGLKSERTDWQQLPTPPSNRTVVGMIDYGGMPMAMHDDGQAWIYGRIPGEPLDYWFPFKDKVPLEKAPEREDGSPA